MNKSITQSSDDVPQGGTNESASERQEAAEPARNENRAAPVRRPRLYRPGSIKVPGPNDVLLGRGSGPNQFWGNKNFRTLVEGRKAEYNSSKKHKKKKMIARQVLDEITSRGGQFLELKEYRGTEEGAGVVVDGIWKVVDEKTALEKCKMTLRQQDKSKDAERRRKVARRGNEKNNVPSSLSNEMSTTPVNNSLLASALPPSSFPPPAVPAAPSLPFAMAPQMSSMMLGGGGLSTLPVDTRSLLFQTTPMAFQSQAVFPLMSNPQNVNGSMLLPGQSFYSNALPSLDSYPYQRSLTESILRARIMDSLVQENVHRALNPRCSVLPPPTTTTIPSEPTGSSSNQALETKDVTLTLTSITAPPSKTTTSSSETIGSTPESEDAVLTLASLTVAGLPKFTEEDSANEQATLTDQERAAVLSDMFGKYCTVGPRPGKRAKRDLDDESIKFLVAQMRLELERIPDEKKPALLEARTKCRADEFSDERLVKFLRVEGMNAELAAQRFVNYWEARRGLFGEDKYLLPMILGEALRDDLLAIETGMFYLLPRPDMSGRPLLFMDPSRHTRKGYTSESMLRAFFYILEVISQVTTDSSGAFCFVVSAKNTSVSDFDLKLMERMTPLEGKCLPVNCVSNHLCGLPFFVRKIIKPVVFATMSRRTRARSPMHDGTESECLEILSSYGITKDMLPTSIGGTVNLDMMEWVANRRAAEMEEI